MDTQKDIADIRTGHALTPRSQAIGVCHLIAMLRQLTSTMRSSIATVAKHCHRDSQLAAMDAIERAKRLRRSRYDAEVFVRAVPSQKLAMAIREELTLLHEVLGQCELPAQMALIDGEYSEAMTIVHDAMDQGQQRCGRRLERLSARLNAYFNTYMGSAEAEPDCETPSRSAVMPQTPLQESILEALDGTALKKDALAKACELENDASRLYRTGGLPELRDQGKVHHKHGIGYFRPDRPPANWAT